MSSPTTLTDPKAQAYYERAMQRAREGNMDAALEDFDKVIEIEPKFADAYYKRGFILFKRGQMVKAVVALQKALTLQPDHPQSTTMREMIKRASQPMKPVQQTPKTLVDRGIDNFERNRLEDAINDFTEALNLDPRYVDAYVNRGAVFYAMGRVDEAKHNFAMALQLNPNHAEADMMRQIIEGVL